MMAVVLQLAAEMVLATMVLLNFIIDLWCLIAHNFLHG
jgi:hypothetical protein